MDNDLKEKEQAELDDSAVDTAPIKKENKALKTVNRILDKLSECAFYGCHSKDDVRSRVFDIAIYCTAAVCITLFILEMSVFHIGIELCIDGESIGSVESKKMVNAAVYSVENEVENLTGDKNAFDGAITYNIKLLPNYSKLSYNDCRNALIESITNGITKMYALYIDGEFIASNPDASQLSGALDMLCGTRLQLLHDQGDNDVTEVRIAGSVEYVEQYCTMRSERTTEEIYQMLAHGEDKSLPKIEYEYVKTVTERVEARFGSDFIDSFDNYIGYTNVIKEGKVGETVNTYNVSYLADGSEISRELIGISVVKSPINQKVIRGTKPVPTTEATGRFEWPCNSRMITSLQGGRDLWGAYDYHYGIDINGNNGDPVYASDSGVVICAENQYSYGNIVMISHGNGYVTYYAHMSRIDVSVGDELIQGQQIGAVGMTGTASGYHLHFEIRYDNELQDPIEFLDMSDVEMNILA